MIGNHQATVSSPQSSAEEKALASRSILSLIHQLQPYLSLPIMSQSGMTSHRNIIIHPRKQRALDHNESIELVQQIITGELRVPPEYPYARVFYSMALAVRRLMMEASLM
ncbi:hypothetical protein KIPB_005281 [Kipferlia bialata]|uniref:Uncharacterized protein n=1 Tax=Kipferlia bialata TaxID=797122 RepID=A0A391NW45_9EUKA|nr:hypothetical protein KIPB_005281 [Kipferlia bialata]|eukprot:g5281.t1